MQMPRTSPAPAHRPMYEIPQLTPDYGNPAQEVETCRNDCALFDFSFVRRASIVGSDAASFLESFSGRQLSGTREGKIRYAIRVKEDGNLLSDLTIWKMTDEHFQVMSGHHDDIKALQSLGGSAVRDLSSDTAIFAVQGPNSLRTLAPLCATPTHLEQLQYFEWASVTIANVECLVGRLGYTGEAGFELICGKSAAKQLWPALTKHISPAGFIAADVLRIEAGFPLFWNDFAIPVDLWEAGLNSFSDATPPTARANALKRVCFTADAHFVPIMWRPARRPVRPKKGGEIAVTSACSSARAGRVLGLGFMLSCEAKDCPELSDPSGCFANIRLETLPYYDPAKARPRAAWS